MEIPEEAGKPPVAYLGRGRWGLGPFRNRSSCRNEGMRVALPGGGLGLERLERPRQRVPVISLGARPGRLVVVHFIFIMGNKNIYSTLSRLVVI